MKRNQLVNLIFSMKYKILFQSSIWLITLIFSCGEKEQPEVGVGKIRITGIDLSNAPVAPGGKIFAETSWTHKYEPSINLNFKELETGKTVLLTINPTDFSKPYEVELPVGMYSISSTETQKSFFEYLPLTFEQQIQVQKTPQDIRLNAKTDYALVTFTKENLSKAPFLVVNPEVKLNQESNFYYGYFKKNQNLSFNLELNQGANSFRRTWSSIAFQHRHFSLDSPVKPEDVQTFKQTNFQLIQTIIPLAENGLPSGLSPTFLANLPTSQNETSGLAMIQNRLFSVNDGDNTNQIFELNPSTGSVIRTISITNAVNIDWEDMAQSETHLFIGDFGNNLGNRKDLNILKIAISELLNATEVKADKINFTFSDQTNFSGGNQNHNFDCEGIVYLNGQLHLFSKNWQDLKTKHYRLSSEAGTNTALLVSEFDTQGLVTAAAIEKNSNSLCLLGYENKGLNSQVFVWLFSNYSGVDFFKGKKHRINLGSPSDLSQAEGLVFEEGFSILISGEKITLGGFSIPSKLHKIDLTGLF
jgi:hypothetical protein